MSVEPFFNYRPAHNRMPSWPDWMAWMDRCFPVVGWNLPLWRVAGIRRRTALSATRGDQT